MTRERIPEGLRERGTRLWKETTDVLDLEAHEELTLLEACRTADVGEHAKPLAARRKSRVFSK